MKEQLEEIEVIARKIYPGRGWEDLSPEEQSAVYQAYEGQRAMGENLVAQGADMMSGAGKEVGPYNVYVDNPYERLGGGLMSGFGYGQLAKSNKAEEMGRGALGDLQTRRDALDRELNENERRKERERFQNMLRGFV